MTGRTHDLAAFTALNAVFVVTSVPQTTLATVLIAGFANMMGGLAPDIDNASSNFWKQIRGGKIISYIVSPIFGGHRLISHSLLGAGLIAFIIQKLLFAIEHIIVVDMYLVWMAFVIGYLSHLITDAFTKEGIPLLFPLPFNIGFPPFQFLRIKTGGLIEKSIVYPGLILGNIWLFYQFQPKYLYFLATLIAKP